MSLLALFARFNAGVNAARIEYARTLADLEAGACGTVGGYRWHINHGETPCTPCRDAVSRSNRTRYAARKKERT